MTDHGPQTNETDTICAIATPPGVGGVGVIRVSGPLCNTIAEQMLDIPLQPRRAHFARFLDDQGETLDSGIAIRFSAPASFTGEDVVEFGVHGGAVTPRRVIAALIALGARPALNGEFSFRAFMNGKMDLAEAEALNQVINSLSRRGQQVSAANLTGRLSKEIASIRSKLMQLMRSEEHTSELQSH